MLPKLIQPNFKIQVPSTKNNCTIRPMLVKEEKILLIAKESNDPTDIFTAIKQVASQCLIDLDVNNLTMFDLQFVFAKIRSVSISNIVKVSYKDQEDEKIYDFEIDLNKDISIKYPDTIISPVIKFNNNNSQIEIIVKYPPAALYDDKGFLNTSSSEFFERLVYKSLDRITVDGTPQDLSNWEEFKEWCGTLPLTTYDQLKQYFTNLPTLYCELNYTNSKGNAQKIALTTLEDFFTLR